MSKNQIFIFYKEGRRHKDFPRISKIILSNRLVKHVCDLKIGDEVNIEYETNLISIKKVNAHD